MTEYQCNLYCRLVQVVANVCVLAGVAVGMYQASLQPEASLTVFSAWFFPILVLTLALSWFTLRRLRRAYSLAAGLAPNTSIVTLPGVGARRVRWTVLSRPGHARQM